MVGGDILAPGQRLLERVDREIVIAVTEHPLALGVRLPAHSLVAERRFDRSRREEDPAVVIGAITGRRREAGLREGVGEIAANGGDLGHHLAAMLDSRNLSHRVDRQVGLLLHRRAVIHDLRVIWLPDLLKHPADGLPA